MTFVRDDLYRHARAICADLGLNPDDVFRLVLYSRSPDDPDARTPAGVPGLIAYVYLRRDGKPYLREDGEPASEIRRWTFLPELP